MTQKQFDILKTLEIIYMTSNVNHIFPYEKTIYNILKGNPNSVNASQYKDSPYYGLYPDLRFHSFKQLLIELIPSYLKTNPKKNRLRYHLTEEAIKYLLDSNESLDQRFFNNPKIENLFTNHHPLKTFDDDYFNESFKTEKGVSEISTNEIGEYTFKSIQASVMYESGDEKRFLEYLDENEAIKAIKTQSLIIEYVDHKGRNRLYYPDFVVHTKTGHIMIVEIKALTNMSYYMNVLKYDALKEYCVKHGYGFGMVGFKGQFYSYEYLEKRPYSKRLEIRVLNGLEKKGKFTNGQYKFFKEKNEVHPLDIHTVVIKNRLLKIKVFDTVHLIKEIKKGKKNDT